MKYLACFLLGLLSGAAGVIALDRACDIPSNVWARPLTEDANANDCCTRGYGACRRGVRCVVGAAGHSGVWPATSQEATAYNAALYRERIDG